ncbi:MAG: hypothetical protein ACLFUU_07825 [Desulfobacteraceae bacterium]
MSRGPTLIRPGEWGRAAPLPALGLLLSGSLNLEKLITIKRTENLPVHVVFPVGTAREAANLARLLTILEPLYPTLIDRLWIAFGGQRLGNLSRLEQSFPGVRLFLARKSLPPDQPDNPLGKGAVMRAFLYHLITQAGVNQPRAVVEFIDADIRPPYFNPRWVIDPVGAVLWFDAVEAAKVVYHRPRGGRLNAICRSFLALCPHPAVQALQKLIYLLSGEIAGTLKFWTALPFKSGYGIEAMILLSLALNQLKLVPATDDLDHLVQIYLGQMDHRHAPLNSTAKKRGLDQMAGNVFHTLEEILREAGILNWRPGPLMEPRLNLPVPRPQVDAPPDWLQAPMADLTLPPLAARPEIAAFVTQEGR